MSSVKEIVTECNRLISLCNNLEERIDVYTTIQHLKQDIINMEVKYAEDRYVESELNTLKQDCSKTAIILEYIISKFYPEINKRYQERSNIIYTFNRIDKIVRSYERGEMKPNEALGDMLCNYAVMDRLRKEARNICFCLTEEEKELLVVIKEQAKKYESKTRN